MPVPPYEPQPDLATQRVPGGRRAAIGVALVALAVVGALLWKPWDTGTPAAATSPGPSSRPAVVHTTPTPLLVILPTTAPSASVDVDLGHAALREEIGPAVRCDYTMIGKGRKAKLVLSSMTVTEPVVTLTTGARERGLHTIRANVVVEVNSLATIFSADWQPLQSTGEGTSLRVGDQEPTFDPLTIMLGFKPESDSDVFRVAVTFDWLDENGRILDTQTVPAGSYGTAVATPDKYIPEGCPATYAPEPN